MIAVHTENCEVMQLLIDAKAPVNFKNQSGSSPLSIAAGSAHVDVISKLISAKADVNAVDGEGFTALFHAAMDANEGKCLVLLNAGASPKIKFDAQPLLSYLADLKNSQLFELMLRKGADPNDTTKDSLLLSSLVQKGDAMFSRLLLKHGADYRMVDTTGHDASHFMLRQGDPEFVKMLKAAALADQFGVKREDAMTLPPAPCSLQALCIRVLADSGRFDEQLGNVRMDDDMEALSIGGRVDSDRFDELGDVVMDDEAPSLKRKRNESSGA